MKRKPKETERSQAVREELCNRKMRSYWEVEEGTTRVSYWTNGFGKSVLLTEHANQEGEWDSWDLYRPLTTENKIAATLQALSTYLAPEPEGAQWPIEGNFAGPAKVGA